MGGRVGVYGCVCVYGGRYYTPSGRCIQSVQYTGADPAGPADPTAGPVQPGAGGSPLRPFRFGEGSFKVPAGGAGGMSVGACVCACVRVRVRARARARARARVLICLCVLCACSCEREREEAVISQADNSGGGGSTAAAHPPPLPQRTRAS